MFDRVILHCDLNNFYASVETLLNPELKGKPIAVCGDPAKRHGIVLAKSDIAKKAGVKTGEAIWEAKQKCPDLIVVPPTYGEYVKYSKAVRAIYTEFTSEVESFGLDECWLDVTGCQKLFGTGEEIAEKIRQEVKRRTGGLTVSIGVSFTKVFAKLGSDLKKPDAITVISPESYKTIAWNLDASEMIYVGRSTRAKLAKLNINTIGDIARADKDLLVRTFGKAGEKLYINACGTDEEPVKCYTDKHVPESIGNGTTTSVDVTDIGEASAVIFALCEMIAFRMRTYDCVAEGIGVYIRDVELRHVSKQCKLPYPTNSADALAKTAIALTKSIYDFRKLPHVRTITVSTFKLSQGGEGIQSSMFEVDTQKEEAFGKTLDKLRSKYGYNVLKRAVNVGSLFNCDTREADDEFLPFDKNMKNLSDDDY